MKRFISSLSSAFQGIVHVVRQERNARIHLLAGIAVLIAAAWLQVTNYELAALFFCIVIVFLAEIVNTALEKVLDLLHPEQNHQVKVVKDIAASAVLVAAIGAAGIGVVVFYPYLAEWL
ncbi:MAG TPA: diacylglycerol kinase family protein [Candidatus Dormibacteraeota bacterium]|nr:diacylglycerol kinase family protein [Candidatus Dormibacteraeota bacterium]